MTGTAWRIRELWNPDRVGEKVRVQGWVRTRRDSKGGFSFLEVNDGSCLRSLQVVLDASLENYRSQVLRLTPGCSVEVEGELVASPGRGQAVEVHADRILVLGWADPARYPLQKKRHSFEFLRARAHLRPRTNAFGAVARIRNALSDLTHRFFQERGFLYLHTPVITGNDCEGAGALFQVTTLDLGRVAEEGHLDYDLDFFGKPAYLTVSGQLEAEAYALALGKVYTFGPTFRAEHSNTPRHLAEFWMVEPEMAFYELHATVNLAESFLKDVIRGALDRCAEDLELLDRFVRPGTIRHLERIVAEPFERMSYSEALALLSGAPKRFEYPVEWGADLQAEHERYLTDEAVKRPVILTDYPKEIKPFYMRVNEDGKTVAALDVLVPRIGEVIGGSQREEREGVLISRMREMGVSPEAYDWYVDLRRYGTAVHSGFGVGFDRLVQLVSGMTNIRDVIPFPRTHRHLDF